MKHESSSPDLRFLDEGSQASSTELSALEKRLGRCLPQSLREWLEKHSGSMLDRTNYFLPRQKHEGLPTSIGVEYMLSVDEIQEALDRFGDAFPSGHVPFGDDGDGNYLLMANNGTVCFWDWRGRIIPSSSGALDRWTIQIAESLPTFLSQLGEGPIDSND